MSNFSTEFPIDSNNTVSDVLRLGCEWITGSPHTKIQKAALQELPENGERTVFFDKNEVWLAHARTDDFEIGGLRYIRAEESLQWTTSIVTLKTSDKHLLSLQVICEAMNTAAKLPPPKKPYFIRQALSNLGGGTDGQIPVTDKPFRLGEEEATIARDLILGTAENTLPIVYVSSGFRDDHLVDPEELARFVSGMAHVVVEPSRAFSFQLKALTKSKNVFGGTIGVYWPKSDARSVYFLDDETPNARAVQLEVAKDIRVALSNRRQFTLCTWAHLKEVVTRNRLEQLKAIGSTEIREYVEAFDADLSAKQDRINEADKEIARLTAEVRRLSAIAQSSADGLIQRGSEQDLYQNEISDIVSEAIDAACRNAREGSRRQHVLLDLKAVNKGSGAYQKLEDEIKTLFKTYQEMDSKTKNALGRLGFDVTDEGKHYKAVFQGDGRYTFSISKPVVIIELEKTWQAT